MIYLDNAATTQVSERVLMAMLPYFTGVYGNPGSIHTMGMDAAKAVEVARKQCAAPINADPNDIIFTSGGSEANSLVFAGLEEYLKQMGKTHVVTTPVEHPSVLNNIKCRFDVSEVVLSRDGSLNINALLDCITPQTGIISIMAVNNETGNSYDLTAIGKECAKRGILFHTDCVQAYGNIDIDVNKDYIDFLSVSGHKLHAPKGVGFLYANSSCSRILKPMIRGGGQERWLRAGTENVPGIVGLGEAACAAYENPVSITQESANKKMNLFLKTIQDGLGYVKINGKPYYGSRTVNLRFDGIDGETLLLLLNTQGICVSAGSACSAHSAVPSHVLLAMGLSPEEARSSIRVSFSKSTSYEEICEAACAIVDSVKKLQ